MQIVSMMRSVPATEDDKLAKAALFTKYVEVLPHALRKSLDCGIDIILDLLAGIQAVVAGDTATHQMLFRSAHWEAMVACSCVGLCCLGVSMGGTGHTRRWLFGIPYH